MWITKIVRTRVIHGENINPKQLSTLGMFVPREDKIVRRGYPITSNHENKKYIELIIRWIKEPVPERLTTQLFDAKVGEEVLELGPTGVALDVNEQLPDEGKDNKKIVCLGGGVGIAQFVSFARHLRVVEDKRELVVLHGASFVDELSYHELFTDLENESKGKWKDGKRNYRNKVTGKIYPVYAYVGK